MLSSHHPRRHLKSFKHAFDGISHVFFNEANFRVQTVFLVLSVLLGLFFQIEPLDWVLVVISCGMLLGGEIINTAIEEFIDHLIKEHHEGARIIKDLCAGYVLVNSFVAVIVFIYVFLPRLFTVIELLSH